MYALLINLAANQAESHKHQISFFRQRPWLLLLCPYYGLPSNCIAKGVHQVSM